MNYELLGISQLIRYNPVINEKRNFKIAYINVLEYFVRKYSTNDEIATETLNLYTKTLLAEDSYVYDVENIKKTIKSVLGFRIKKFKLITYRYFLLYDCFFINAINDNELSQKILDELKLLCGWRYRKKFDELYLCLYGNQENTKFKKLKLQLEYWKINREHLSKPLRKILITANMSAGKSTLINAIIGKSVNKMRNTACTSKIHRVFNKPTEDDYISKYDDGLIMDSKIAELMTESPQNKSTEIIVGSYFRSVVKPRDRICIIDTPGVSFSLDKNHRKLTYELIAKHDYDMLICVLNATNLETEDDFKLLKYLSSEVNKENILFVVNQVDKYNEKEDNIEDCIKDVKEDLKLFGFENSLVCPVSAYAGFLAKKYLYSDFMTETEEDELQLLIKKLGKKSCVMKKYFRFRMKTDTNSTQDTTKEKVLHLLENSGVLNLERILFG